MKSSVFFHIFSHMNSCNWPVVMKVRLLSKNAFTYSKSPSAAFISTAPTAVIVLQAKEDQDWKNHLDHAKTHTGKCQCRLWPLVFSGTNWGSE